MEARRELHTLRELLEVRGADVCAERLALGHASARNAFVRLLPSAAADVLHEHGRRALTPERLAEIKALPVWESTDRWDVGVWWDLIRAAINADPFEAENCRLSLAQSGVILTLGDAAFIARAPEMRVALDELVAEVDRLLGARQIVTDYADHDSWRCYSTRYPDQCLCGLDDAMNAAGLGDYLKTDSR